MPTVMPPLFETAVTPLVRTDYANDRVWRDLIASVRTPTAEGFFANVSPIEDRQLDGAEVRTLMGRLSAEHALLIVADKMAMENPAHPLLCVDPETGRTLRVIASELWSLESNLSLANMEFEEFAAAAGPDGVFRGFG